MSDTCEDILETELESLAAIYINELTFSRNSDGAVDKIELLLHPATGHDTTKQYVCMTLVFLLNSKYPDELPQIEIRNPRGLGEEEISSLVEDMMLKAEDCRGESMLYTLIEMAKDSLTEGNIPHCPCVVCLEHFHEQDKFHRTACYHYFHTLCLCKYLLHARAEQEEEERQASERRHLDLGGSDKDKSKGIICPVCRTALGDESLSVACSPEELEEKEKPEEFIIPQSLKDQQLKMAELFERQKAKGGIIDLDHEKNKYLLNPEDRMPLRNLTPTQAAAPTKDPAGKTMKKHIDNRERNREKLKSGNGQESRSQQFRNPGRGRGHRGSNSARSHQEWSHHNRNRDKGNQRSRINDDPSHGNSMPLRDRVEDAMVEVNSSGQIDKLNKENESEELRAEENKGCGNGPQTEAAEITGSERRSSPGVKACSVEASIKGGQDLEERLSEDASQITSKNNKVEPQEKSASKFETNKNESEGTDSRYKEISTMTFGRRRTEDSHGRGRYRGFHQKHTYPSRADVNDKEDNWQEDVSSKGVRKGRKYDEGVSVSKEEQHKSHDDSGPKDRFFVGKKENRPGRFGEQSLNSKDVKKDKNNERVSESKDWQHKSHDHGVPRDRFVGKNRPDRFGEQPVDSKYVIKGTKDDEGISESMEKQHKSHDDGVPGDQFFVGKKENRPGRVKEQSMEFVQDKRRHEGGQRDGSDVAIDRVQQAQDASHRESESARPGSQYKSHDNTYRRSSRSDLQWMELEHTDDGDGHKNQYQRFDSQKGRGAGPRYKGSKSHEGQSSYTGHSQGSHARSERPHQHYYRYHQHQHGRQAEGREGGARHRTDAQERPRVRTEDVEDSGMTVGGLVSGSGAKSEAGTQDEEEADLKDKISRLKFKCSGSVANTSRTSTVREVPSVHLPSHGNRNNTSKSKSHTASQGGYCMNRSGYECERNDVDSKPEHRSDSVNSESFASFSGIDFEIKSQNHKSYLVNKECYRAENESCLRNDESCLPNSLSYLTISQSYLQNIESCFSQNKNDFSMYYVGYDENEEENWDDEIDMYAYERYMIRPEHLEKYDKLVAPRKKELQEKAEKRHQHETAILEEEKRMLKEEMLRQKKREEKAGQGSRSQSSMEDLFKESVGETENILKPMKCQTKGSNATVITRSEQLQRVMSSSCSNTSLNDGSASDYKLRDSSKQNITKDITIQEFKNTGIKLRHRENIDNVRADHSVDPLNMEHVDRVSNTEFAEPQGKDHPSLTGDVNRLGNVFKEHCQQKRTTKGRSKENVSEQSPKLRNIAVSSTSPAVPSSSSCDISKDSLSRNSSQQPQNCTHVSSDDGSLFKEVEREAATSAENNSSKGVPESFIKNFKKVPPLRFGKKNHKKQGKDCSNENLAQRKESLPISYPCIQFQEESLLTSYPCIQHKEESVPARYPCIQDQDESSHASYPHFQYQEESLLQYHEQDFGCKLNPEKKESLPTTSPHLQHHEQGFGCNSSEPQRKESLPANNLCLQFHYQDLRCSPSFPQKKESLPTTSPHVQHHEHGFGCNPGDPQRTMLFCQ